MIEGLRPIIGHSTVIRDRALITQSGLEVRFLGSPVGSGFEHTVYRWEDERVLGKPTVVKVPTIAKLYLIGTSAVNDAEQIRHYFPDEQLIPDYMPYPARGGAVLLQERIYGECPSVLDARFTDFLTRIAPHNKQMYHETGASLDLHEVASVLLGDRNRITIPNFMFTAPEANEIRLIDTSLFHTNKADFRPKYPMSGSLRTRAMAAAHGVAIRRQSAVLQHEFGIDMI